MTDAIHEFELPLRAMPKKRPRLGQRRAYHEVAYQEWLDECRAHVARQFTGRQIEQPVALTLSFHENSIGVTVQIMPTISDAPWLRPKYVRGDIDNLAGGVMDAMQGYKYGKLEVPGVYRDDRQVVDLQAFFRGSWRDSDEWPPR